MTWPDSSNFERPEEAVPALFETAVMPLTSGRASRADMRVSGTPQRPNPPQRIVESEVIAATASSGVVTFDFTPVEKAGAEEAKARRRDAVRAIC